MNKDQKNILNCFIYYCFSILFSTNYVILIDVYVNDSFQRYKKIINTKK